MIKPNRPKALQTFLLSDSEIWAITQRIAFLKLERGDWPWIVFNEGNWWAVEMSNIAYEKGVDIFPILIDIEVDYLDYMSWYELRNLIRKKIGKFNGSLTADREGSISFQQFLSHDYNPQTDKIVMGSVYLLKQNYDYDTNP
jgi:hypothetical protein